MNSAEKSLPVPEKQATPEYVSRSALSAILHLVLQDLDPTLIDATIPFMPDVIVAIIIDLAYQPPAPQIFITYYNYRDAHLCMDDLDSIRKAIQPRVRNLAKLLSSAWKIYSASGVIESDCENLPLANHFAATFMVRELLPWRMEPLANWPPDLARAFQQCVTPKDPAFMRFDREMKRLIWQHLDQRSLALAGVDEMQRYYELPRDTTGQDRIVTLDTTTGQIKSFYGFDAYFSELEVDIDQEDRDRILNNPPSFTILDAQ